LFKQMAGVEAPGKERLLKRRGSRRIVVLVGGGRLSPCELGLGKRRNLAFLR